MLRANWQDLKHDLGKSLDEFHEIVFEIKRLRLT